MSGNDSSSSPALEQARNELFSHILRCGVLEADAQHQKEWFDDTMDYLADRYDALSDEQLTLLRTLGERYCRPVISHPDSSQSNTEKAGASQ